MKLLALFLIGVAAVAGLFFSPEFLSTAFALAIYAGPDCSNCDGNDQLEVEFSDCPQLKESEINHVYIVDSENGSPVAAPTDWTAPADWAAVLDQAVAAKIRKLTGVGSLPAPEQEEVQISNRRKAFGLRTYQLTLNIDEFTLKNYAWARELQCGGTKHIWFSTIGGFLFGGENGIKVTVIPPTSPMESGENVYHSIQVVLEWRASYDPPVIADPLSPNSGSGS